MRYDNLINQLIMVRNYYDATNDSRVTHILQETINNLKEINMSTTTINLDSRSLFEVLTEACADTFPWYRQFQVTDDGHNPYVTVTMDTGHSTKSGVSTYAVAAINATKMRRAIAEMLKQGQPEVCSVNWSDPECDSEVDAGIADCVFQHILLGDIVFG